MLHLIGRQNIKWELKSAAQPLSQKLPLQAQSSAPSLLQKLHLQNKQSAVVSEKPTLQLRDTAKELSVVKRTQTILQYYLHVII